MNRFKRVIALLLCIATMLSLMGNGIPTAVGEGPAAETAVSELPAAIDATMDTTEETNDFCDSCVPTVDAEGTMHHASDCKYVYDGDKAQVVGKYIAPTGVVCVSDSSCNEKDGILYLDEFEENTILKVNDWYWNSSNTALWYHVEIYSGGVVETAQDFWPEDPWVLYDYTDESSPSFEFVDTCDICLKPDCTVEHVYCDICGKYDCGVDHTEEPDVPEDGCDICDDPDCDGVHIWCEVCQDYDCGLSHVYCYICGKLDCTAKHVWCGTCGKYDCGLTHEDIYTPPTAPIIPDYTLPEGEDIAIVDKNGNVLTEDSGFLVPAGMKTSLAAFTRLGTEGVSYKWQLRYGENLWVDIRGLTGSAILTSAAMFASMIDHAGTTALRVVATNGTETLTGPSIPVTLSEAPTSTSSINEVEKVAVDMAEGEGEEINLIVEYKFNDNKIASNPWTAELGVGDSLAQNIKLPVIAGYLPSFTNTDYATLVETNGVYTLNVNYPEDVLTKTTTLKVTYQPTNVNVSVLHYWQNEDNDNYVLHETVNMSLLTNSQVGDVHKVYPGFYNLLYEKPTVAADGSTVVEVYYDRYYYLIKFDLGEDGYGVDPIYARYGSKISDLGEPTRAGYDFLYWDLKVDTDDDGDVDAGDNVSDNIPATVPAENQEYIAVWSPLNTKYTVAYWIQNDDGTTYSFAADREVAGTSGVEVDGVDDFKTSDFCGLSTHAHVASCYKCQNAGHTHTAACFVCGESSHATRIDQATLTCGHVHTASCVESGASQQNPSQYDQLAFAAIGEGEPESGYVYTIDASADANTYYYLYIDGVWYHVQNNNKWASGNALAEGVDDSSGRTYTARKYNVSLACGHIHDGNCTHTAECYACETEAHSHSTACKSDIAKYVDFVKADQDNEIKGDGSAVINVYYKYRTYTIRFIYARQDPEDGTYQIATLTNNGVLTNCNWSDSEGLPTFTDPSGKTERSSVVIDGITYYYISLKAKFGADISAKWPSKNIGNVTAYQYYGWTTHNWGSWAAAAGTGYRIKYGDSHANIVGPYPVMSADMILDNPEKLEDGSYLAQNMIAWWGANQGITTHAYHNYFEILPGESTTGAVEYNGKYYKLVYDYRFTAAHNEDTRVDPIYYNGYKCINDTRGTSYDKQSSSQNYPNNGNCTLCGTDCDYCNTFYYDRNVHKLYFWNFNGYLQQGTGADVMYGDSLQKYGNYVSDSFMAQAANYPKDMESGAYKFDGWYTSSDCLDDTEMDWTQTMPDADMTVYAKWVPVIHTVRFFLDKSDYESSPQVTIPERLSREPYQTEFADKSIEHKGFLTGVDTPEVAANDEGNHPYSQYDFNGWYYIEGGVEKRFVAGEQGMPVTSDLDLYAKWSSNVLRGYTINYVLAEKKSDGTYEIQYGTDGKPIQVADPITGSSLAGNAKTFEAKGDTALYATYQEGYFPHVESHTITLSIDDEDNVGENTFTFLYTKAPAQDYTVRYLEKGTERVLKEAKTGTTLKAVITENFVPISGYMPDAYQKTHVILVDEDNVITFWYTEDTQHALYQVNHYIQNLDGETWSEYKSETITGDIGSAYSRTADDNITGFTFSHDYTDLYNKTYVEDGTTYTNGINAYTGEALPGSVTYPAEDSNGNPIAKTVSGTLTNKGMQLNLYYTRVEYPYEIYYLEYGTQTQLKQTETGTAPYGQVKTVRADPIIATTTGDKEFELYDSAGTKSMTIVVDGTDEGKVEHNILTFYYKRCTQNLTVGKTVTGSGADLTKEFNFTVTIDDKYAFHQESYAYTKGEQTGYLYPDKGTGRVLSFTLKHGESITINDLPTAEYTIAETNVPLGYYADIDAETEGEQSSVHIVLDKDDSASYTCTNTYDPAVLTISKTVDVVEDGNTPEVNAFVYTINGPDAFDGFFVYTIEKIISTPGDAVQENRVEANDGVATVSVQPGYMVRFLNLPVGEYTVTENDYTAQGYKSNVSINGGASTETREATVTLAAGETDSVAYMNKFPVGDLIIEKTVKEEYFGEVWETKTFTFTIVRTDKDLIKDNVYQVTNGSPVTVTEVVENGVKKYVLTVTVTFTAEEGQALNAAGKSLTKTLTLKNLPVGTYSVTEAVDTDFTQTASTGYVMTDGTANMTQIGGLTATIAVPSTVAESTAAVAFENTVKRSTGNLRLAKKIQVEDGFTPPEGMKDVLFTFKVDLTDVEVGTGYMLEIRHFGEDSVFANEDDTTTVYIDKASAIAGNRLVENTDGTLTIMLKHGEYANITGLPIGDYIVTEYHVPGYGSSFNDIPGSLDSAEDITITKQVTANVLQNLVCTNRYPFYNGDLIVKKVVARAGTLPEDVPPANAEFAYTVQLTADNATAGTEYAYTITNAENAVVSDEGAKLVLSAAKTLNFTLKHGEQIKIEGLPTGKYTVTETGVKNGDVVDSNLLKHYTVTSKKEADDGETVVSGTNVIGGTIAAKDTDTIEFTNTYKQHLANLTITKTLDTPAVEDVAFVFTVSGKVGGNGLPECENNSVVESNSLRVIVYIPKGERNASVTVYGLPVGTYTVTEDPNWSWRYSDAAVQEVTLPTNDPVIFENTLVENKWLSGDSYAENYWTGTEIIIKTSGGVPGSNS